jgi:prephenate dehydratase
MSPAPTVAFLGPEGTFAHMVARRRFGARAKLVPQSSVGAVFTFVAGGRGRLGVAPIENTSGGAIYDTVDRLIDPDCKLRIQESLSLNVKLALAGRKREDIQAIYSHFVPLQHCEGWLKRHFPRAELRKEPSTASAMQRAAEDPHGAAIGNRHAAGHYGLKILEYPIESEVLNVTQFFVLGHSSAVARSASRTTLVVSLPNRPGSLCDFLTPFKDEEVNLSRIISRHVAGKLATYVFLIDVEGTPRRPPVKAALTQAAALGARIRVLGCYPVRKTHD